MSGGASVMSGVSGGITRQLPELKKVSAGGSVNRGQGAAGSSTNDPMRLRKASPEALALMMANKKKNDNV